MGNEVEVYSEICFSHMACMCSLKKNKFTLCRKLENLETDKSHINFDFLPIMNNYYKYLPVSQEDKSWGLYLLNAGCNRIDKSKACPPASHPTHHYFNLNKGRVFNEFQIIYMTKGEGIFESESCPEKKVKEGTIILLFPPLKTIPALHPANMCCN